MRGQRFRSFIGGSRLRESSRTEPLLGCLASFAAPLATMMIITPEAATEIQARTIPARDWPAPLVRY